MPFEIPGQTPPSPLFSNRNIYSFFLLALLLYALYLSYVIVAPFLNTLVLSAVLAFIFSPVNARLLRLFGGRKGAAALATVGIVSVVIIIPLYFLLFQLVVQGVEFVAGVQNWLGTHDVIELITASRINTYFLWLKQKLPLLRIEEHDLQSRVIELSKDFAQYMLRAGTSLVGNMAVLVFQYLLMTVTVFYFLRDGRALIERIRYLCPLKASQEDILLDSLKRVSRSVLLGSLTIGVLQGVTGGLGLLFVGIPALLWGTMMGLSSLIPVIGTGLVWVPAVIFLLIEGNWGEALFLALWCGLLVTGIDTLLRPILMREASRTSAFYVFLAILGGVAAFGFKGILYGPLILSFVMVMLDIYSEEYKDFLTDPDKCGCGGKIEP